MKNIIFYKHKIPSKSNNMFVKSFSIITNLPYYDNDISVTSVRLVILNMQYIIVVYTLSLQTIEISTLIYQVKSRKRNILYFKLIL